MHQWLAYIEFFKVSYQYLLWLQSPGSATVYDLDYKTITAEVEQEIRCHSKTSTSPPPPDSPSTTPMLQIKALPFSEEQTQYIKSKRGTQSTLPQNPEEERNTTPPLPASKAPIPTRMAV